MGDDQDAGPSRSASGDRPLGAAPPDTHSSTHIPLSAPQGGEGKGGSNTHDGAMSSSNPSHSTHAHQAVQAVLLPPPPSVPTRPIHDPTPRASSSIPAFIRRITFILSLVLGASSAIALVFSALVLPRLHASYSARKALVDQQSTRFAHLLDVLRGIRSQKLYDREPALDHPNPDHALGSKDEHRDGQNAVLFEEISSASSTNGDSHPAPTKPPASNLTPDLAQLHTVLGDLATTRGNTSTTRASLLSTLESYTSSLHRALWSPRPGHGGYSVGLNSLNANLAKERHGGGFSESGDGSSSASGGLSELGIRDLGEEYDAVRREIRGIKGMLLNRRNFTPLTAGGGGVAG